MKTIKEKFKEAFDRKVKSGSPPRPDGRGGQRVGAGRPPNIAPSPVVLSEEGWKEYRELLQALADRDTQRFGVASTPKENFDRISKSYAKIFNHLTKGLLSEFVLCCFSAGMQTFSMLSERSDNIDKAQGKKKPPPVEEKPSAEEVATGKKTGKPRVAYTIEGKKALEAELAGEKK